MKIRPGHFIVVALTSAVVILFVFLVNSFFSDRHRQSIHKYDPHFRKMESAFDHQNYDRVLALGNEIIRGGEVGSNVIRAKCYIGLAKLKTDKSNDAIHMFDELMQTYPGVNNVYAEQYKLAKANGRMEYLYRSILVDYLPAIDEATTSKLTLTDIFATMDYLDWIKVLCVLVAAVVAYEKLTKKVRENA